MCIGTWWSYISSGYLQHFYSLLPVAFVLHEMLFILLLGKYSSNYIMDENPAPSQRVS